MATREEKLAALQKLQQSDAPAGPDRAAKLEALQETPDISTSPAPTAGQALPSEGGGPPGVLFRGIAEEGTLLGAATAGAVEGSKIGAELAPGGPRAKVIGSALGGVLGATLAGAGHEFGFNVMEQMAQDPGIGPDFRIAWNEAVNTGTEEGMFEAVGRLTSQALPGSVKALLNTVAPKFDPARLEVSKWLQDQGVKMGIIDDPRKAGLTLGMLTDSNTSRSIESLIEDSTFGGPFFKELADSNDEILRAINQKALKNINSLSLNEIDDLALGDIVVDAMNNGETMMFHIGKRMYGDLDKMIPGKDKIVDRTVAVPGIPGISSDSTRTIQEVIKVGPVDTRPVKDWAKSRESDFLIEKTQIGNRLMRDILNVDSDATFSRIHELRSAARARRRSLKGVPDAQNARSMLNEAEGKLTSALEKSAVESTADPQALRRLKNAERFWRDGNQKLNNALIQKIMRQEDTPEKLGAALFHANNRSSTKKVREAVEFAGKLGKKARRIGGEIRDNFGDIVEPIDSKDIWSQIQGSYAQRFLETSGTAGELADTRLIKMMGNPQKAAMFNELLDPTQRAPFEQLVKTMRIRQGSGRTRRSMLAWKENSAVITLGTTAVGAASGAGLGNVVDSPVLGATGGVATLAIGSRALARMLTRPEGLKLLGRAADAIPTSQEAGAIALRIRDMVKEIENELGEDVSRPEDDVSFGESDVPQVKARGGPF